MLRQFPAIVSVIDTVASFAIARGKLSPLHRACHLLRLSFHHRHRVNDNRDNGKSDSSNSADECHDKNDNENLINNDSNDDNNEFHGDTYPYKPSNGFIANGAEHVYNNNIYSAYQTLSRADRLKHSNSYSEVRNDNNIHFVSALQCRELMILFYGQLRNKSKAEKESSSSIEETTNRKKVDNKKSKTADMKNKIDAMDETMIGKRRHHEDESKFYTFIDSFFSKESIERHRTDFLAVKQSTYFYYHSHQIERDNYDDQSHLKDPGHHYDVNHHHHLLHLYQHQSSRNRHHNSLDYHYSHGHHNVIEESNISEGNSNNGNQVNQVKTKTKSQTKIKMEEATQQTNNQDKQRMNSNECNNSGDHYCSNHLSDIEKQALSSVSVSYEDFFQIIHSFLVSLSNGDLQY